MGMPSGHQGSGSYHQGAGQIMPLHRDGYVAGPANSSMAAVAQLFARLSQEIEEQKPPNCIHFIVNFLCKHYPEHLHGFASIWNMDPDLERERHEVVNFFKSHKISTAVAAHFTNAGYDTLDTLTTLSADQLVDVEAFNNVKWLPGHKVRLQQIFSEIPARIRAYRQANPGQTTAIVGGGRAASPGAYRGRAPSPSARPYDNRPASPRGMARPIGDMPMGRAAPGAIMDNPGAPREYVVGVSAPVRVGPQGQGMPQMAAGRDPYMQQQGMNLGMQLQGGQGAPMPGQFMQQQQQRPGGMVPQMGGRPH